MLATVLAVLAAPLALGFTAPAQAVPSGGLMITEVYPGGGNSGATYNADFVELYNAGSGPISLQGKSIQYRSSTNTAVSGNVYPLPNVSVPSHGYFLVAGGSTATGAAFPRPADVTTGLAASGSSGQVYLADSAVGINAGSASTIDYSAGKVIDFFGYGAASAFETAPKTGTITTTGSYKRTSLVDGDNNNVDFVIAPVGAASGSGTGVGPDNCDCVATSSLKITEVYADGGLAGSAIDHDFLELQNVSGSTLSMTGLTLQYRAPGDTGPATVVATLTGTMAANSFETVQLAGTTGNGAALASPKYTAELDLSAAGGTVFVAKTAGAYDPGVGATGNDQFRSDLVGWGTSNTFEAAPADAGDFSLTQSIQRENGGVDNDTNAGDFDGYVPSPKAQPSPVFRTIPEIQGIGAETTMANANVSTAGVVTAAYANGSGNFNGFYLQTPGYNPGNDLTPDASDAIFVYTGTSATFPTPAIGKHVTLASARVSEFSGMTELTATNVANLVVRDATPAEAVVAGTVVPGTACTVIGDTTDCLSGMALAAVREKHEGELFAPTAPFTVSDSYDGTPWNQPIARGFQMAGEIGLAANDIRPLVAPTEVANPRNEPAKLAARKVYNDAHMITLDDGAAVDYTANDTLPFPWFTPDQTVRIGAGVSFVKPVIFDYRNDLWKLQPQGRVSGAGTDYVSFVQNRPAAPNPVGGNVKIATFNMLNYFVHPAEDWAANSIDTSTSTAGSARTCSYYTSRSGERLTANTCTWTDPRTTPPTLLSAGPRGAATATSLGRQEAKEVASINTIDADVMSLEEVENAVKIGYSDRDAALKRLVDALNADWNGTHVGQDPAVLGPRWAYAATPRPEALPTIGEQDAIRSAFIYNPRVVQLVGRSRVLVGSTAFRNARQPLAQAFKRVGAGHDDSFIVIVNHFKSKGSSSETGDNVDLGDGAGSWNGDRRRQAAALDAFARQVSDDKQIDPVFMTGDYNAYSHEDPIVDLEAKGWHELAPSDGEKTYSFGGLAGTLDHVFANDAAFGWVTGQAVWPINANESVYYEYSRYNNNVTNLYAPNPFRSSDHNPEVIGINAPLSSDVPVDTVQVLASNDFHGRLLDDPASASAGAAAMAGAVKGLRAANPDTAFVMAGDIIGASTFESFIQNDKPTLDAMNEAGLEVSAAGNHEFDQGYNDLMDRVMASYDAGTNPEGGANWPYIAANVRLGSATGDYALASDRTDGNFAHSNGATWWKDFPGLAGGDGIRVGFVGAVTEDLDSLVSPAAIDGLAITSIVDEVNTAAADLKANGCGGVPCDLVIELVHEGAPSPSCSTIASDATSTFGRIVHDASVDVDAIVSGHTHLKYNCKVAVAGKPLNRPVVSAGQYGSYLNQLEFDFTPGTDALVGIRQHVLAMKDYDEDAATKAIVTDAVNVAAVKGAVELGQVGGAFKRARRIDALGATVENRGGESTLGNQIAEMQRWKTGADIGVMNPGGLRDDLLGTDDGPGPVTYREAANVQPFANTLVTTDLTGAQLKLLLEQQWQRDPDGNIPSRPFLRLGTSKGFTFTEDSSRLEGDRITGMWLDEVAIDPAATYTVAANSFVASGGDNFRAFTLGTNTHDSGFTDLQATVDYLAEFADTAGGDSPLAVDYRQHAVGARAPSGPIAAGATVTVPLDSLSMTGAGDVTDSSVTVSYRGQALDTETVATTLPNQPFDTAGKATVSFPMPGVAAGLTWFKLTGATGTVAWLPVTAAEGRTGSTVTAPPVSVAYDQPGSVVATVTPTGATGSVTFVEGTTTLGTVALVTAGGATTATYDFVARSLSVGDHTLTISYGGDDANKPSTSTVVVTVAKVASAVTAPAASWEFDEAGAVVATVAPTGATGTVELFDGVTKLGEGTLATAAGATTTTIGVLQGALSVGSHDLTLKYLGDASTASDEGTVSVNVVKATSTVTGTAADIAYGNAGSVEVTVTPASATGMVELYNGATMLGQGALSNGSATIPVAAKSLEVGPHDLTLKYLGDANTASDEGIVAVAVVKAASSTAATASPSSVVQDSGTSTIAVAVTASGFVPTGSVSAWNGATQLTSAPLVNGQATLTVGPFATTGDKAIEVRYAGDSHAASSLQTVALTVTAKSDPAPQPAASTVSGTATPITYGIAGSVTIQVAPATATGKVELFNGATRLGAATLAGGSATIAVPAKVLEVGTHTLVVRYLGSTSYNPSQNTVPLSVLKATPTVTLKVKGGDAEVGKKTEVVSKVSAHGYGVTGTVKFVARLLHTTRKVTTTVALRDGRAVGKLVLPKAGKYKLTARYQGDSHTLTGTAKDTVVAR